MTTTNEIKEGHMTGKDMMNNGESTNAVFQLKSGSLILGAALMGASCVIGLTGLTICASTVIAATRRWISQMDVPPSELARLKWAQAKAATAAGTSAWQDGVNTGSRA